MSCPETDSPAEETGKRVWSLRLGRRVLEIGISVAVLFTVPHLWCVRYAGRWYRGEAKLQEKLGRSVARWMESDIRAEHFDTVGTLFDAEWAFGTYFAAGMGYGQVALEHPALRGDCLRRMDFAIEQLLTEDVRAFDRQSWDEDPLLTLDGHNGHAAYLGYLNLLLSLRRFVHPDGPHAELNDRITAALARRVARSSTLLLETYPREAYPVDNCAVIGSIGLYDRATGADHSELLRRWIERCKANYVHPETGLLYQAVGHRNGDPQDAPRGSGTCLGLYFLSFSHPGLSAELYRAVKAELTSRVLGFGGVREYPRSWPDGRGDVDSGPIVWGFGMSATGFALGGARVHDDRTHFADLYATAHLVGAPVARGGEFTFLTGGPLGDALMFAMLTAQSPWEAR